MWPFFFNFSISLPIAGGRSIGHGRPFCCIKFVSRFHCMSTFTLLFPWNQCSNFLLNSVTSGPSGTFWIFRLVFSVSSLIPNCFIQSNPIQVCSFCRVVISSSKFFVSPIGFDFRNWFSFEFHFVGNYISVLRVLWSYWCDLVEHLMGYQGYR